MASSQRGGAENFFARLAQSLDQTHQIDQHLFLRHHSPYLNAFDPAITTTFDFARTWNPCMQHSLRQHIKSLQPDVMLTWMNRATRIVGQLHRHKTYPHIARLGGFYKLKYYQHVDHFIANTRGIADYLLSANIPAKRIHLIGNFVHETPGIPLARPDRPLVVSIGRLHTNKAFDTLIRAIAHCPDTELWIAGEGPEQSALLRLIDELNLSDRVKLLGWQPHPEHLIATADVFVCPSRHEPLGNVILEAWAQKKAVIATQNQGAVELITPGQTGYLCEVDNATELANTILSAIHDQPSRETIAQRGHQAYQSQFSRAHITQVYLDLFRQLVS